MAPRIPEQLVSSGQGIGLKALLLGVLFSVYPFLNWADSTINVAVATSLKPAFEELVSSFELENPEQSVTLISGATGALEQQIQNGAPYDLFFAADTLSTQRLVAKNLIIVDSMKVFAVGDLIFLGGESLDQFRGNLSIANPETAPYGRLAKQVLAGLDYPKDQRITSANARAALEYYRRGEVQGTLVPFSLLTNEERLLASPSLAQNHHACGILNASKNQAAAQLFLDFIVESSQSNTILEGHGFKPFRQTIAPLLVPQQSKPWDYRPLWISTQVAISAAVLSLLMGILIAVPLSKTTGLAGRLTESILLVPLVLPPTVLGFYLLVLIGQNGPIGAVWLSIFGEQLAFTKKAAVIAATLGATPLVARQLILSLRGLPADIIEAAKIDGAGWRQILAYIHLPLMRNALITSGGIALARSLGDFGATLMVAASIPGKTQTASLAIYDYVQTGAIGQAMLYSFILIAVSLVLLGITSLFESRQNDLS